MLVSIGECMVEVAPDDGSAYRIGYAGDTFNAAWTARLILPDTMPVRYVTAIGNDWISDGLLEFVGKAGIGADFIRRDPVRTVGLYAIRLVEGERSFAYWRRDSAATGLGDDPAFLSASLQDAAIVLVSGITLAILPSSGRDVLLGVLQEARARGVRVAFDPNYRERLWSSRETAREALTQFCSAVDIVLPSFSDEADLFGDIHPETTVQRFRSLGVNEIVVKNGPEPALCMADGTSEWIEACPVGSPVDTTGAGDAFNGAYLAARLTDASPRSAVVKAHRVAALAVQTRGALIPSASFAINPERETS